MTDQYQRRMLRAAGFSIGLCRAFGHSADEHAVVQPGSSIPTGTWGAVKDRGRATVIFRGRNQEWDRPKWVQAAESEVNILD